MSREILIVTLTSLRRSLACYASAPDPVFFPWHHVKDILSMVMDVVFNSTFPEIAGMELA